MSSSIQGIPRLIRLTDEQINAIVHMDDAVQRNLWITESYHALSVALRDAIGQPCANWCTFATWASKTAGDAIRGEEVPRIVQDAFSHSESFVSAIDRFTTEHTWFAPFGEVFGIVEPVVRILRDVSVQIGIGNLAVYAELAPFFDAFCDDAPMTFRQGRIEDGGQSLLESAFANYREARRENDPVKAQRLIYFGNCQIGLHEQTRLQPQIAAAMNAPVVDILGALFRVKIPLIPRVSETLADALSTPIERAWREIMTEYLLRLTLPFGNSISLGDDVTDDSKIPLPLEDLTQPEGLLDLWSEYTRDGDPATRDWADLTDRMGYILHLFRSRHADVTMFTEPFTREERDAWARKEALGV